MKTLLIICGFQKTGTSALLFSLAKNKYIKYIPGVKSKFGEIREDILDEIPKLNKHKENLFICKQPTYIYNTLLLVKIKKLLDKYNIDYKIIITLREMKYQIYSLYYMRKKQKLTYNCFKDFLEEKHIGFKSTYDKLDINNRESLNYYKYIKNLEGIFDNKKIYIIMQKKLNKNNKTNDIEIFLNIKVSNNDMIKYKESNTNDEPNLDNILKSELNNMSEIVNYVKSKNYNIYI
jgi:hypothetical protein